MAPRRFADVALPIPLEAPLTYEVPPSLIDRAVAGMRAVVPLGKRVETGYITALRDDCPLDSVRAIIDLPDEGPVFLPGMIELCAWIADYYCCSIGEALQCAVPSGIRVRSRKRYTLLTDRLGEGRYTDRQRKIIAALHRRGPLTESQLAKEAGATALSNTLLSLERRGLILAEAMTVEAGTSMRTETWVTLVEDKVPGAEDLTALQRRAPKQAAVYLDLVNGDPERSATALYERHGVDSTVLRALEAKGLVEREEREYYRTPDFQVDERTRLKHALNPDQEGARSAIAAAIDTKEYATFLLRGITGSGKTEVYLQTIEHALEQGRDAILLVPEISLTPQTVGRFLARFDTRIAVLHSGLAAGERYDEWRRAQRGEVRIVVGARSAVFAPLPNLGIVVVDEEHDTSYKQGDTPRYHARDVAVKRAQLAGAVCVLGSATPSVESFHNSERGKSVRLELRQRATSGLLPEVRLVDMRIETKEQSGQVVLSRILEDAVKARVVAGEQVILLLNRRGHSPFVLCPQCGWVAECTDCMVSMTFHQKGGFLSCHYCNLRQELPQVCGNCHFNPLIYLGTGTQKVEEFLLRAFPNCRIERMDADTTAGKGGHAKILGRFAAGEIDILIGTQMIAKGHDYPGVTLVGVINADTGLSIPDFRAAEQSFQLLTQVAGRAGRGDKPGAVIVQTYRPKHFAVECAARHDYDGFYAREIQDREHAAYPPFRRMAQFAIEAEEPEDAERAVARLKRIVLGQIEALGFHGIEVVGPAPAVIRRVKRKYRWNLGAFSKSAKRLNALVRASRAAFAAETGMGKVDLKVDLDPYGMF